MRRDMGLVNAILRFAAQQGDGDGRIAISVSDLPEQYHSISERVLAYHLVIMHSGRGDAGFLAGNFDDWMKASEPFQVGRLTEKGRKVPAARYARRAG